MTRFHPPLCIDSGAFSAYQQNTSIPFDEWIEFCHRVGGRYKGTKYVNLDVISKGRGDNTAAAQSYRNWRIMREAGLNPMPVYHVNSDVKWLKRYLRHTDYIGLGAMAKMPDRRRIEVLDRLWRGYLLRPDGTAAVKVHGMGLTSFSLMLRYPWYSFDSTTWMMQSSYGRVYMPLPRNGKWDYVNRPTNLVVSAGNPSAKDIGKHYCTLSPARQQVIQRFVSEVGVPLGRLDWTANEGRGILNDYYARCCLNALVISRHIQTFPHKPIFYLSGKIPVENFMRQRLGQFDRTGIMLSFYSINHSDNTICSKRLRALEKNKPVEFMKTRKKRKA